MMTACVSNTSYSNERRPYRSRSSGQSAMFRRSTLSPWYSDRRCLNAWLVVSHGLQTGTDRICTNVVIFHTPGARMPERTGSSASAIWSHPIVHTRPIPGLERTVLDVGLIRFWRDPLRIAEMSFPFGRSSEPDRAEKVSRGAKVVDGS